MEHYLNSDQIYLFSTIVDKGSFSKAAQHAGVHVSTVTRQIDNLEELIGSKLFIRSSRHLGLTESGHFLYGRAKYLLKDLSDTVQEIRCIEQSESGLIRMSCLPTFGKMLVIPIIANSNKKSQKIQVNMNLTERLVDPIIERLDLAIRVGEQPDSSLYSKKIGLQSWHICASPELVSQFSTNRIHQLQGLPLIDKCSECNSLCWKGLEKSNFVSAWCDDFEAQLMMAIEGIGFCCLPNWVIASSIADGKLLKVMDDPFTRLDPIYALRPFQKANVKVSQLMENIEASLKNVLKIVSA